MIADFATWGLVAAAALREGRGEAFHVIVPPLDLGDVIQIEVVIPASGIPETDAPPQITIPVSVGVRVQPVDISFVARAHESAPVINRQRRRVAPVRERPRPNV